MRLSIRVLVAKEGMIIRLCSLMCCIGPRTTKDFDVRPSFLLVR